MTPKILNWSSMSANLKCLSTFHEQIDLSDFGLQTILVIKGIRHGRQFYCL